MRGLRLITATTIISGSSLLIFVSGCMTLPVYYQPQGFSSTYYRQLQLYAAGQMPPPGMMPPPAGMAANSDGAASTSPPKTPAYTPQNAAAPSLDVPRMAERADILNDSATPGAIVTKPLPAGSAWNWLRRPLSFGSAESEEGAAVPTTEPANAQR